jgi:hypothetical protein
MGFVRQLSGDQFSDIAFLYLVSVPPVAGRQRGSLYAATPYNSSPEDEIRP